MLQLNSNLKVLSAQKFKMEGVKFFQFHLDQIKSLVLFTQKSMPPSAIAAFMGLMTMCGEAGDGLLPLDFTIAKLQKRLKLPYNTTKDGFRYLLEHNLVRERFHENSPKSVYEIVRYAEENRTKAERPNQEGSLSYFRLPEELFNTSIIPELVSKRDSKGLLLLLKFFNGFTREFGKNKDQLSDYKLTRTVEYLKKELNRSSKRVREYLEIINPLFHVTPINVHTRKAHKERDIRVRKMTDQTWVEKYIITLSHTCVVEGHKYSEVAMKALKEANTRLRDLGFFLKQSDKTGIARIFYSNVVEIANWLPESRQPFFIMETMTTSLDVLEQRNKTMKVDNPGGQLNKLFRAEVTKVLKNNPTLAYEIHEEITRLGGNSPQVIRDYLGIDNKQENKAS